MVGLIPMAFTADVRSRSLRETFKILLGGGGLPGLPTDLILSGLPIHSNVPPRMRTHMRLSFPFLASGSSAETSAHRCRSCGTRRHGSPEGYYEHKE